MNNDTYFPLIFCIDFFRKLGNNPTSFKKLKKSEKNKTTPKGAKPIKFGTASSKIHLIPSASNKLFTV